MGDTDHWLLEYVQRFGSWPDAVDYPAVQWLPDSFMNWLSRRIAKVTYRTLNKGFNKAVRHFGLRPYSGSAFFEGDYNLFAESPGFSGLPVPSRLADRHRFIGPLIARFARCLLCHGQLRCRAHRCSHHPSL